MVFDEEQRQALLERVTERWRALEQGDYATSWEYTSPAFRKAFPKNLYLKKFSYAVRWELTGVDVLNYDDEAVVASVVVGVMSHPTKLTSAASQAVGAIPRELRERWVFVDGEWWYSANY
ncbi:hypothetical protein [Sediminihaliea albiluteola]|uniref:hypothetical protein n=1 Tax=Sediminihaliea albiluteola TaxID=2758564 RepID=UPI001C7136DB|nr:hypothetical protein [Sediminihaliea albiluteola]